MQEISNWLSTQSKNVICTNPSETKTTCLLNYTAAPLLQDSCEEVGAIFVETTFVYQCTFKDGSSLFYTAQEKPECYHASCQVSDINSLEDQSSSAFIDSLAFDDIDSCNRVRLQVSEPVYPDTPDDGTLPQSCEEVTTTTMSKLTNLEAIQSTVTESMQSSCVIADSTEDNIFSSISLGEGQIQSCEANFDAPSQSIAEECESISGFYLEVDYTLACKHPTEDPMVVSVIADPVCSSKILCTLQQLQEIATTHSNRLFFLSAPSEWNCTLLDMQLEDFAASASPTVSPAPTLSPAPSVAPTLTALPTSSPAPTPAPTEGSCSKMSIALNDTTSIQEQILRWTTKSEICELEIPDDSKNSSTNDMNVRRALNPQTPCEILQYLPPEDLNDTRSVCEESGGMYAQEIFTIHCESEEEDSVIERKIWNKPACRHPKCNGQDFQDILREEMEWMRTAMEVDGLACDVRNIKILPRVGNVDGFRADGSLPEDFQVTDECRTSSDQLNTIIALYNEHQLIIQNFELYTQVDMRQICVSPIPGTLNCQFDWGTFTETDSAINYESLCQDNGGQFLTGEFVTTCSKPDEKNTMHMFSRNVPGCLGASCSPGQAELYWTDSDDSWITQQYVNEGWACETSVISVFASDYLTTEERPILATGPSEAPVVTSTPTANTPIPTPSSNEGDESDPLGNPTTPATAVPSESMMKKNEVLNNTEDSDKPSGGVIAGIALGVVFVLCCCCVLIRYALTQGYDGDEHTSEKYGGTYDGEGFDDEMGGNYQEGSYNREEFDDHTDESYRDESQNGEDFDDKVDSSDREIGYGHGVENDDEGDDGDDDDDDDAGEDDDDDDDDFEEQDEDGSSDEESDELIE